MTSREIFHQKSHLFKTVGSSFGKSISVVMPLYKPNFVFLENAIQSILSQTFQPTEIICVSDGLILDEQIRNLLDSIEGLRILQLPLNVGQGSALAPRH